MYIIISTRRDRHAAIPVAWARLGFDRCSGRNQLCGTVSIYRLRTRGRTSRHTFRFQLDALLSDNRFRCPLRFRSSRLDLCRIKHHVCITIITIQYIYIMCLISITRRLRSRFVDLIFYYDSLYMNVLRKPFITCTRF